MMTVGEAEAENISAVGKRKLEGIIPALESAHALALLPRMKDKFKKDDVVVLTVSGRGDKDMQTYLKHINK